MINERTNGRQRAEFRFRGEEPSNGVALVAICRAAPDTRLRWV